MTPTDGTDEDRTVLGRMADGVALVREEDGTIVYVNRAWAHLLRRRPHDLVGRRVAVLSPAPASGPRPIAEAITAELDGTTRFSCWAALDPFEDGERGRVRAWFAPRLVA
jgi:PAS domain-containing protein